MALPKNTDTPRGLELKAKLMAADQSLASWPQPTKQDIVAIGGIVVLYSYVDFNLRRLAEVFDYANLLPDEFKGKSGKLDVGQVARAVQEAPIWAGPDDVKALKELEELRLLRNLVAHFAVRRFPDDVHIRALTGARPIKPTSPRCHSAWQPNLGRRSTYRRGESVQTIGTTSDLPSAGHVTAR
jgi:hypothetical protein